MESMDSPLAVPVLFLVLRLPDFSHEKDGSGGVFLNHIEEGFVGPELRGSAGHGTRKHLHDSGRCCFGALLLYVDEGLVVTLEM